MARPSPDLLTSLLKQVSRSFYLTLRVLPGAVRPQIGLAYLLARATDTVADTELVPLEQRLRALRSLRDRIMGQGTAPLNLHEFAAAPQTKEALSHSPTNAERTLLERIEEILLALDKFEPADQARIREVIQIIASGQILDLERFGAAATSKIAALQTEEELDDYTYRVAGCVGEFWTKMCRAHVFPSAALNDSALLTQGIRFGKGLQLVNVLRDLPADLRRGRCYLPANTLKQAGLTPGALLDQASERLFGPLYHRYLTRAHDHLLAGWAYTNALPWPCVRVRLACAWPILIGARTLERLATANVLGPGGAVKIDRAEVRKIIALSVLLYPWPGAWNLLLERQAARIGASEW